MKYFHAYSSCSDNSWSNRAKPSNYYAAKSIKDVIQKERIEVCSYTLNKVNKYGLKIIIKKSRTPTGKGYGQWEDNSEFDFEKDLTDIVAVSGAGGDTHIKEILIDFL
jgi:hypothetical protein